MAINKDLEIDNIENSDDKNVEFGVEVIEKPKATKRTNKSNVGVSEKKTVELAVKSETKPKVETRFWETDSKRKISIRNISNVGMSFIYEVNEYMRQNEKIEIIIPPNQARLVPVEEIIHKFQNQNISICGSDGLGNNASLIIENDEIKRYFGFDGQVVITDDLVEKLLSIEDIVEFKKTYMDNIKTYLDEIKVVDMAIENFNNDKLDSVNKIKFIEEMSGKSIR